MWHPEEIVSLWTRVYHEPPEFRTVYVITLAWMLCQGVRYTVLRIQSVVNRVSSNIAQMF